MTASARRAVNRVGNSAAVESLTRLGLAGYGVLHLAVAWIVIRIATGSPAPEGDQSGAFKVLAAQPLGSALVWTIAVGLFAMAVWQLIEAIVGHTDRNGARRVAERIVSAVRTIVYVAFAVTAIAVVRGAPASSANRQRKATAGVLGWPGGPFLVGLLGLATIGVGLVIAVYGAFRQFERNLKISQMDGRIRRAVVLTGQIGYTVKGAAYAIVGVLLLIAASSYDPGRSTGLDGALRSLAARPYGVVLLAVIAAGFAVYGVFSFGQSRYRKV